MAPQATTAEHLAILQSALILSLYASLDVGAEVDCVTMGGDYSQIFDGKVDCDFL